MYGPNEVFWGRQRHFNGKYERHRIQFHRTELVNYYYISLQDGMFDCCYGYALNVRQVHVVFAYSWAVPLGDVGKSAGFVG